MKPFFPILLFLMSTPTPTPAQAPRRAETVRLGDVELYYEVYGEGEPLLLLHGWTQSSAAWAAHIPHYARHYEVYAVDLRGHGRSSPLTDNFSIPRAAADLGALIDHLKLDRPRAIGLSFGGLLLLQLAAADPGKVGPMVVIGASHRYDGSHNRDLRETFRLENLPPAFLEELRRTHVHGEDQVRALFDPSLPYRIHLSEEQLRNIANPTLIVVGDRDEVVGVETPVALYRGLPRARLWVIPNAGHTPLYDGRLPAFLEATTAFLGGKE